jgi:hypothetical protein
MAVGAGNFQLGARRQKMKSALWAAMIMAGLGLAIQSASAESRKLKGPEITQLLTGKTIFSPDEKDPTIQTFQSGGLTAYLSRDKQQQGRWQVVGDKYCSAWDESSQPKCSDVYVEPPAIAFVGEDGEKHVWFLEKP